MEGVIQKSLKSLRDNDVGVRVLGEVQVIIDREKWLRHAYDMEAAGAVQTCGAIVRSVLEIGVEPEDRRRT